MFPRWLLLPVVALTLAGCGGSADVGPGLADSPPAAASGDAARGAAAPGSSAAGVRGSGALASGGSSAGGSSSAALASGGSSSDPAAPGGSSSGALAPGGSSSGALAPGGVVRGARPAGAVTPGATRPGRRPPVVDHGPRTGHKVALTFDADLTTGMRAALRAGSVRSYANLRILDRLERDRVPATFFLTGLWVEQYPAVTRRIAANPRFELANHTYGHEAFVADCYGLPRIAPARMTDDVARTFRVVAPYGGRQTRYFRFPGLCHDGAALAALAPLGVTVVDGDVVSGDPFATAWEPIVRAVLDHVRPGSVIVLHVTEANAPMTDEALPHILAGLRARGLVPAPLSEVLAACRSSCGP